MDTTTPIERIDTVVIGGGQAGLSAGYHLARRGLPFVILDADARIGDHWRDRWDSLKLYSPAQVRLAARACGSPRRPRTGRPAARWPTTSRPTRDGSSCRSGAGRASIASSRSTDGFVVSTAAGSASPRDRSSSRAGRSASPTSRRSPPQLDPSIRQLHSHEYRNPSQLRDGPVLVVGLSHSGADIAIEAASAGHRTILSGRSHGQMPIRVTDSKRAMLGWPVVEFVFGHVITMRTPMGRRMRPEVRKGGGPLLRVRLQDLDRAGVERHDEKTVGVRDGRPMLADGTVLDVANVIWATGYRPDYCVRRRADHRRGRLAGRGPRRQPDRARPVLPRRPVPVRVLVDARRGRRPRREVRRRADRGARRGRRRTSHACRLGRSPPDGRGSGREVALRGADVPDVGPDQPVVGGLLEDVGRPAGVAGERERRREEVRRQADALEDRRRVVLDVCLQRPARGAARRGSAERRPRPGSRAPASRACAPSPRRPCAARRPAGRRHGRRGGRSPSAARRGRCASLSHCLGVLDRADLRQLVDDLRRCAAVERPLHRADGSGDGRRDVGPGRDDDPRGERRGVEAVLGADDEVGVERARRAGVRTGPRELVQEALDEVERRIRVDRFLALAEARERGERRRRERRQRSGLLDGRRLGQVCHRAPDRDGRPQRVHRLRRRGQRPQRGQDGPGDRRRREAVDGIPFAASRAGSRPPDTCRARRGRRSGSRGRSGGRARRRPCRARSRRR